MLVYLIWQQLLLLHQLQVYPRGSQPHVHAPPLLPPPFAALALLSVQLCLLLLLLLLDLVYQQQLLRQSVALS